MSICMAMRGLTLQQNQLFRCPLQIWCFQPCISKFEWQDIWDCCKGNKLHSIYPTVGIVKHSKNISRYDSVLFNKQTANWSFSSPYLCAVKKLLTHSLSHSYLLCVDDPPTCQSCGIPLTVKHILLDCDSLQDIREKYFTVSFVADLFKSADDHTVINFIKETHFTTNCNVCYFNFILAL